MAMGLEALPYPSAHGLRRLESSQEAPRGGVASDRVMGFVARQGL